MSDYHRTNIGASYRKDYLTSTQSSVDGCIWYDAYIKGYRKPNYPMPVIHGVAEYLGDELTGEFWGIFIFNITEYVEDAITLASWKN